MFLSQEATSSRDGESGAKASAEMASLGGCASSNCVAVFAFVSLNVAHHELLTTKLL